MGKEPQTTVSKHAKALSSIGAKKGGLARTMAMTPEQRAELARKASQARWGKKEAAPAPAAELAPHLPVAKYRGVLSVMELEIPCYVLENGQRVIGRTSVTEMLTGIKGGGGFEKYLDVQALRPYVNFGRVLDELISFELPEIAGLERKAKGLQADLLIEICQGMVAALDASRRFEGAIKLTDRQQSMAINASLFLAACAKVGIDALIDEATGYQYERAEDALQVKLRAYLEKEIRKWEKTFPDELWREFARLTNWHGSVTQRPKYWGKLVMELIYEYLDQDVAQWLREHAPAPRRGQNYHQWLSSQYGLRKLVEHIWKVIGISSQCKGLPELKQRMKETWGRGPLQLALQMPEPRASARKGTAQEHGNP